jgi:hypothetical protein
MASAPTPWQPARILNAIEARKTSSRVLRVETDQGEGFLKAMGADNGPNVLACELVGTLLARWLKLRTLRFTLIDVPGDLGLRFADGKPVVAGPAFITQAEQGHVWSGDEGEPDELDNPEHIGRLIVFDTWTMNCDRYRPANGVTLRQNKDNVFFSEEGASKGKFMLKAIDQGCCFTCENDLTTPRLQSSVNDDRLFGLFPAFRPHTTREAMLQVVAEVEAVAPDEVETMIDRVPHEWQVDASARREWCDWICRRARSIRRIIEREWPPATLTDLLPNEGQKP